MTTKESESQMAVPETIPLTAGSYNQLRRQQRSATLSRIQRELTAMAQIGPALTGQQAALLTTASESLMDLEESISAEGIEQVIS